MGWPGDRFSARALMLGAAAMIGGGTVLLGNISELWHSHVIYGIFVGSMGHAAFSVLLPVIMTKWFYRNLGIAMGMYWAGQSVGPMIFAPLFHASSTAVPPTRGCRPTAPRASRTSRCPAIRLRRRRASAIFCA